MSSRTTQWVLELIDNITAPLRSVQGAADAASGAVEGLDGNVDGLSHSGGGLSSLAAQVGAAAFAFNQVSDSIGKFNQKFQNTIAPGIAFQSGLTELSVVTGIVGDELDSLGQRAKDLSETYGNSAVGFVDVFNGIVARFGESAAQNDKALQDMAESVAILSDNMQGDTYGAMDALTTTMQQFGINTSDSTIAATEMSRIMNVLAAGSAVGSSEVKDTSAAMKEAGLAARQANMSVEETVAAFEAMAYAGSKGSVAGNALRKILTDIAGKSMIDKQTVKDLKSAGVDIELVTDNSAKFTDRLRELRKVSGSDMIKRMFGANWAIVESLMENTEQQDEWTKAITNTNAALEGSAKVQDTYAKKSERTRAWIDNLKISFFNATESIAPFIGIAGDAMQGLTDMGGAVWSLSILFKKDLWTGIGSAIGAMGSWISTNIFAKTATLATTAAQWLFNAALWANPITWVVAGIAAFAGAMVLLWNKCEGFRAVLYGLWEVIKGFADIIKNYVIDRIKGFLSGIGALGEALVKLFQGDFQGAFESAKEGISGIVGVEARMNAYNGAKKLGEAYAKGAADGREAFQKSKQESGVMFPPVKGETVPTGWKETDIKVGEVVLTDKEKEAVKRIGKTPVKELLGNKTKKDGSSSGSSSGGSSSSGGKSIAMNVTLNITNYGVNDADRFTEQVVRKINDRLSDALAIA
jgi:TP901 family phage tail tape measure protein